MFYFQEAFIQYPTVTLCIICGELGTYAQCSVKQLGVSLDVSGKISQLKEESRHAKA